MSLTFRPAGQDLRIILDIVTSVLQAVGLIMLAPATLGLVLGETDSAAAFAIAGSLAVILRAAAVIGMPSGGEVRWIHGMVGSGIVWLAVPFLGALPLFLSGHFPQFLDGYFDAMSAVTTAGLSVINDLDHLSRSMNLWRHIMHFLGGQGLVLLTLTFFASGGGAVGMYAGEAREDKILPNVRRTAQFIWRAALVFGVFGTVALTAALLWEGMSLGNAVFHAVNLFFAAFDTGGFSPQSTSVAYYHSWIVEGVLCMLMVAGAFSFAVHFALWRGRASELVLNIEARTLAVTTTVLLAMTILGLAADGIYSSWWVLLRRGLFQLISAHTGAGFASVPGVVFSTGWGMIAPAALVLAMTIGGMSGSTTGGFKAIRLGLAWRMVRRAMNAAILPRNAVQGEGYHHIVAKPFDPLAVRAATTVLLLFLFLYFAGTTVGLFYGYPFEESLFESTSAAAGVGLSVGITSPDMPVGLQITYILQMWIGRLEFISALALGGYIWSMLRGKV